MCVCRSQDMTRFCEEQSHPGGREQLPAWQKTESEPLLGDRDCVDTTCADVCSIPTSCRTLELFFMFIFDIDKLN